MKYLDEISNLLQKLEPVFGNNTNTLWYLHLLSKNKKEFFDNRNILRIMADKIGGINYLEKIRLPPPKNKSLLNGKYLIGEVIYPESHYGEIGLEEEDFIKHILISGITGAGKTNLSFIMLQNLLKSGKPFLVFDWKQSYRELKELPDFKDLKIIRLGNLDCNFKFNPLIPPPGVHPKHWLALLIDVIKHAFYIAHGGEYFFRKGIDALYKRNGVYEGKNNYPIFENLEKLLLQEYVRGREMLWMSSVKRVLASLTFSGLLCETINSYEQTDLEELFKNNIIFEMDNLATIEKIFLVEALLLWIYHYRKNQGKTNKLRQVILIEEAHHTLSAKKEYMTGEETIIESVIRMIREFGVGIIAIDQEPSKLSNSILANTNCKICFNLGHGNDIAAMSKAMNLTLIESRFIDKLEVGNSILKLKSRFSEPIQVKFPLFKLNNNSPVVYT